MRSGVNFILLFSADFVEVGYDDSEEYDAMVSSPLLPPVAVHLFIYLFILRLYAHLRASAPNIYNLLITARLTGVPTM